jgi:hypothetical protein
LLCICLHILHQLRLSPPTCTAWLIRPGTARYHQRVCLSLQVSRDAQRHKLGSSPDRQPAYFLSLLQPVIYESPLNCDECISRVHSTIRAFLLLPSLLACSTANWRLQIYFRINHLRSVSRISNSRFHNLFAHYKLYLQLRRLLILS